MEDLSFEKRAKKDNKRLRNTIKNLREEEKKREISEKERAKKKVSKRISSNYKYAIEDKYHNKNTIIEENNTDYEYDDFYDNPYEISKKDLDKYWCYFYQFCY
jgi:hypothetical protein